MINVNLQKMWNILNENDFKIDVAIKSKFICTSCKNILIQPCKVPCECKYCHDCLIRYLNGEEKLCLGEFDYCKNFLINIDKNVFPDQETSIKISSIVVKCPMESCEFKTELGHIADHMRTCNRQPVTCPYYTIGCHDDKIDSDRMKHHLQNESYCHARLLMDYMDNWKNDMKLLETNMLVLQKENQCAKEQRESKQKTILALEENVAKLLKDSKSLREELEIIKLNNKSKQKIISALQTKSEDKNKEIGKAKENCEYLEVNQKQMKTRIEELFQENKLLRNELATVKQDKTKQEAILSYQTKTEEQRQSIKANSDKIEDLKQRLNEKCNQIERNQEQMSTRINKICQENGDMPTQSMQIETKLTQAQPYQNCTEFLWCIQNWKEKKKKAQRGIEREIYSDPFYSHKNGYKMCLKLDLCGGGNLFVGICMMRSDFDNILQWPFKHSVKLDLLNQKTGLPHVTGYKCYENNPNCSAWKKPTRERDDGYYGYPFMKLSDLSSDLCQDNQILINATLLMKS